MKTAAGPGGFGSWGDYHDYLAYRAEREAAGLPWPPPHQDRTITETVQLGPLSYQASHLPVPADFGAEWVILFGVILLIAIAFNISFGSRVRGERARGKRGEPIEGRSITPAANIIFGPSPASSRPWATFERELTEKQRNAYDTYTNRPTSLHPRKR